MSAEEQLQQLSDEEDIPEEEEQAPEDLVVVDDDLVESLLQGIAAGVPVALAQAVDVILGVLGYKATIVIDDDISQSPLLSILPPLEEQLVKAYNEAKEGSAKKDKVETFLQTLASGIFDSFDKFKKGVLFDRFCASFANLKSFSRPKTVKKVMLMMANVGFSKKDTTTIYDLFGKMIHEEEYVTTTFQVIYRQITFSATSESLEKILPPTVDFFVQHKEEVIPYVKSLIKRLVSEIMDCMSQKDKSVISWGTIGTCQLIEQFILRTECHNLLYPFVTALTAFLKNFAVKMYLPFQMRIAFMVHELTEAFDVIIPVLSWICDCIEFIVSCPCKDKSKGKNATQFSWETDLKSPEVFSFEWCDTTLDRLAKLARFDAKQQAKSIAFPEYIMPVKKRLQQIVEVAKNQQLAQKVNALIRVMNEQQTALTDLKKELAWSKRNEQLALWNEKIDHVIVNTPLVAAMDKQRIVEEQIEEMKRVSQQVADETGDIVTIATADDV